MSFWRVVLASCAAAAAAAGEHVQVLGVAASVFSGSGPSPLAECAVEGVDVAKAKDGIFSHFGAGGGGARWQHGAMIISLGDEARRYGKDSVVGLRLGLDAKQTVFDQPSLLYVAGLREQPPGEMHWSTRGSPHCPPPFCRMPDPRLPDAIEPKCGFEHAEGSIIAAQGPSSEDSISMEIDVSPLLAANHTWLKVWAVPTKLSQEGMWQTARFTLHSLAWHGSERINLV